MLIGTKPTGDILEYGSSISGSSSRQIGERHEIAELNCGKLQLGE